MLRLFCAETFYSSLIYVWAEWRYLYFIYSVVKIRYDIFVDEGLNEIVMIFLLMIGLRLKSLLC